MAACVTAAGTQPWREIELTNYPVQGQWKAAARAALALLQQPEAAHPADSQQEQLQLVQEATGQFAYLLVRLLAPCMP